MARVFVLDDDPDLLKTMVQWLAAAGHEVRDSQNGFRGRQLIEMWHPDQLIVDIGLPGEDGLQIVYRLKQQLAPPKIIAVSGGPDLPVAADLGADAVLSKPFRKREFDEAVDRLLAN